MSEDFVKKKQNIIKTSTCSKIQDKQAQTAPKLFTLGCNLEKNKPISDYTSKKIQ